jgi:hypothetical protein
MPTFDPELIALMRSVLDEVMLRVPPSAATSTTKALLAESILKTAAQGQISYDDLFTAALDHIQTILSSLQ